MADNHASIGDHERHLLTDVFKEAHNNHTNVNAIAYRAQHEEDLGKLDILQRDGYLQIDKGNYHLTLKGLLHIAPQDSAEVLEVCRNLFPILRQNYKNSPKDASISVNALAQALRRHKDSVVTALIFMRDTPIWGGYSTDMSAHDASVSPSEAVLRYKNFDEMLGAMPYLHGDGGEQVPPLRNARKKATRPARPMGKAGLPPATLSPQTVTDNDSKVCTAALSDDPASSDKDSLEHKVYADAIVDFLCDPATRPPLTFAITGPWGSGKSTLLDWIKEDLCAPDASPRTTWSRIKRPFGRPEPRRPTIWFNAWKHSGQEQIWAALAKELVESDLFTWPRQIQLFCIRLWSAVKRYARSPWPWIFLVVAIAALLFRHDTRYVADALFGLSAGIIVVPPFWKAFRGPIAALLQSSRGPNYDKKLGFQREFEEDIKRLIGLIASESKPLIVLIDDLDRAPPPIPARVLEAVNLVLGHTNCMFVLGLDTDMVAASIEAKYLPVIRRLKTDKGFGQGFIEKFVQMSFAIPTPSDTQMAKYLETTIGRRTPAQEMQRDVQPTGAETTKDTEGLSTIVQERTAELRQQDTFIATFDESEKVKDAMRAGARYLGYNPRRVKRFINSFRLLAFIANRRGLTTSMVFNLTSLAQVTAARLEYPQLFSRLAEAVQHGRTSEDAMDGASQDVLIQEGMTKSEKLRGLMQALSEIGEPRLYLELSSLVESGPALTERKGVIPP